MGHALSGICAQGPEDGSGRHQRAERQLAALAALAGTRFTLPRTLPQGDKRPVWFALGEERPLAFFAGIWTRWTSVRKIKEGETINDLFAFLTCGANAEVGAIHPKAMPVILTLPDEIETWLTAPAPDALQLQRPLDDGLLMIVARGEKQDG
jgi:putative SOS response-associated peptidase YedK